MDGAQQPFLLGGEWRYAPDSIEVRNPYDGSVVGYAARASREDVLAAIALAEEARRAMQALTSAERAHALDLVSRRLAGEQETIARLIVQESGKPLRAARVEAGRSVVTFRTAAEEAKRIEGEFLPMDLIPGQANHWGIVRRFPVGIVAGITAFNGPLNLIAHKIGPALASGNCALLKPAPQAPLTALFLARLFEDSGLPPGALSFLPCTNEDAEPLITDERIGMLSFTGSLTGWKLREKAGRKRVTLELGGNSAVIVHEDADLDLAVPKIVEGAYGSSGQRCISVQRVLVHRAIAREFTERFVAAVEQLVTGDPMDPRTDVGPLMGEHIAERTVRWIEEAVAEGAELLAGGKREGNLMQPSVLRNPPPSAMVCREELFAPVAVIREYDDFAAAIEEVNDSRFGLQAGLFTRDMGRIFHAFERLEVGGLMVNETSGYRMEHMPYGGVKLSGTGREGIRYAIDSMTEQRVMVLNVPQL